MPYRSILFLFRVASNSFRLALMVSPNLLINVIQQSNDSLIKFTTIVVNQTSWAPMNFSFIFHSIGRFSFAQKQQTAASNSPRHDFYQFFLGKLRTFIPVINAAILCCRTRFLSALMESFLAFLFLFQIQFQFRNISAIGKPFIGGNCMIEKFRKTIISHRKLDIIFLNCMKLS